MQKKAVRIISVSKYNAHTDPIFKSLKLLKLEDILAPQQLKFYFKYTHNQLLNYFNNSAADNSLNNCFELKLNSNVHSYNTRNKNNLHASHKKHKFSEKCLRHNIVKTVNSMPPQVLNKIYTHSLHGFKIFTKLYLISNYSDTCDIPNCYICNRP